MSDDSDNRSSAKLVELFNGERAARSYLNFLVTACASGVVCGKSRAFVACAQRAYGVCSARERNNACHASATIHCLQHSTVSEVRMRWMTVVCALKLVAR
jgi:hypothetical protein